MAILEDVPGVTVTVRINGVDCVEYDDPEAPGQQPSQPTTSSKYIESPDDTEFTIHIKVDSRYDWSYKNHSLKVRTFADATYIGGVFCEEKLSVSGIAEREITGKYELCRDTGYWQQRKPKFSAVKTVDDATKDRVEKDKKAFQKLGLIEVKVWRAIVHGPTVQEDSNHQHKASIELAEKSIKGKAISHGTTFSTAKGISKPSFAKSELLLEDNGPIAIFLFRYRSKEALQQELIIPATPPPLPSLDGLSEAEVRRLAAERLTDLNERKFIKEENTTAVKRELNEVQDLTEDDRPTKIQRLPSQVIDLTEE